jgi:hypothetical protein
MVSVHNDTTYIIMYVCVYIYIICWNDGFQRIKMVVTIRHTNDVQRDPKSVGINILHRSKYKYNIYIWYMIYTYKWIYIYDYIVQWFSMYMYTYLGDRHIVNDIHIFIWTIIYSTHIWRKVRECCGKPFNNRQSKQQQVQNDNIEDKL